MANKLKGRALEAYDNMSVEDLESYEDFEANILRACELRRKDLVILTSSVSAI